VAREGIVKVKAFKIVAKVLLGFEEEVNRHLAAGWQLYGPPFLQAESESGVLPYFYQAMVLPENVRVERNDS
jgi:hypothetical protein